MLRIYNSLTKMQEEFIPLDEKEVKVYTCGPTVYSYVTIGNWRTYTLGDLVIRTLKYLGYDVKYVMNITDVGHLTGDNLGDADTGEDRLEKASKREGKSAWDIAEFYTNNFYKGFNELNLERPLLFSKATEHITEQIELVKKIEEKGMTYQTSDGIYFNTKAFEEKGRKYGELSNLDEIKEGARVEVNPEKKDPRDFALWKFSPTDVKREMEWDSPWGVGFPGWHIECSAMSMKYLGDQLDIHLGGEDLRSTHHPNEIAQSEAATGISPFVKHWMHGAFLLVDGGRMGKSLGNAYTIEDLGQKGFTAMHLRYFYLTGHYRKQLNFTLESLEGAKNAYEKLVNTVASLAQDIDNQDLSSFQIDENSKKRFLEKLEDDINMPQALSEVWCLIKSDVDPGTKLNTLLDFDRVLGLNISKGIENPEEIELSTEVKMLLDERETARNNSNWNKSDEIRDLLKKEFGFEVKDTNAGQVITRL